MVSLAHPSTFKMDLSKGDPDPKRGDLIHTNVNKRRERTWFVLHARLMHRPYREGRRFELLIVRWWELDPEMRMRLFRSAERNGGQSLFRTFRYPPKKKRKRRNMSFEAYMQAGISRMSMRGTG